MHAITKALLFADGVMGGAGNGERGLGRFGAPGSGEGMASAPAVFIALES
jgi:hypothetical protein